MWFKAYRLDEAYDVMFVQPAFKLPTMAVDVLETFYNTLKPKFSVRMSDLQSFSGASYSDIGLRVVLFGGSATITVTPESMSANFAGVNTLGDQDAVVECVRLCLNALTSALPEVAISGRKIAIHSWLTCEGGADAVGQLLDEHGQKGFPFGKGDFESDQVSYRVGLDLRNREDGWNATVVLDRSAVEKADLFYRLDTTYLENGRYNNFDVQIEHTRTLYLGIIGRFGLEPSET